MGVTKDRPNMRMRLHILLWGGPGTGKSEFLNWYQQKMDGVLVNSELTSKTGLVGDARGKSIHPGFMPHFKHQQEPQFPYTDAIVIEIAIF